ncbi:hypothetical protein DPMN_156212 [Dreissena polymorpha]|uniref:Uncharacterized protein n=1 Tax=Dreissena polymorpha TaxID=45954 RepID=A0A9D4JAM6_DREPO|nr:hypothetical protein DPMN_156212 [Dreissena polymorpha]
MLHRHRFTAAVGQQVVPKSEEALSCTDIVSLPLCWQKVRSKERPNSERNTLRIACQCRWFSTETAKDGQSSERHIAILQRYVSLSPSISSVFSTSDESLCTGDIVSLAPC